MKVIVAPDKFKGSLTSFEAGEAIRKGIQLVDANANVLLFPMADGGDGFAAVLQHYLQTTTVACSTTDPLGSELQATYQWNQKNKTAIVEMAVASGLVLLSETERNPMLTSTYGTGLLIKDALKKGATKIIVGLGGSATNDAGMGILIALGFQFRDANNQLLQPSGQHLALIETIIPPDVLPAASFEIACDVQNTLYGANGAAYVYGPQKGATPEQVVLLDKGLQHIATVIKKQTGKDVAGIPGAGAAGGIAAGLMAYLDVTLLAGTDMVIEASGIKEALRGADLLITGEGKIDEQSKEGKVIASMVALAKANDIPVAGLCGKLSLDKAGIAELGLDYASGFMDGSLSLQECMQQAAALLEQKAGNCFSFYNSDSKNL
jgi:glycerate kinase